MSRHASRHRDRIQLEHLEDRLTPATFNINDGDVAAFVAAVNASNANDEADTINLLRRAYKLLYRDGSTVAEAVAALTALAAENPASAAAVDLLKDFVRDSQRGVIR